MKVFDVRQNTDQWMQLRSQIPTASEMHRVICPEMKRQYICNQCGAVQERKRKKCAKCGCDRIYEQLVIKPSTQQEGYLYQLLAASFGVIKQSVGNGHTDRGHELQPRALAAYELITQEDVQAVGFCTTDDDQIGCSPDGFVGDYGLVEAKAPGAAIHLRHVVEGDITDEHKVQVQAQMLVTGRKWCDVVSHCEDFPPECRIPRTVIFRAARDEAFISGMNDELVKFIVKYQTIRAGLIAKYGEFVRKAPVLDPLAFEADVSSIWEARANQ